MSKVYDCWWCWTPIDRPDNRPGQPAGGLTCECGKSYHNPHVSPQDAAEFFRILSQVSAGAEGGR